jgi:cell division protein ZipA
MAAELRWILLGLSLVLLAGIWWWGARRSAQAPGNAALREKSDARLEPIEPPRAAAPTSTPASAPAPESKPSDAISPEWVSPFEPLSIRATGYEQVPVLDGPMMVNPETAPVPPRIAPIVVSPPAQAGRVPTLMPEQTDRAPAPAQVPNASEQQKIVTLRVCAAGEARWAGSTLLSAFELHGLAYGRYQVFHRRHVDGRSLFCVASLAEPGTFDVARMASEEFRGVTLFAVMPGPAEPLATIDELFAAARGLAQELSGMVQDAKGMPLSPQRAAALREDVARFQASLPKA